MHQLRHPRLSAIALAFAPALLGLSAGTASAESMASSASSAGSASIGSLSDSSRGSSRSSGEDRNRPTTGQYRVQDVQTHPQQPGMMVVRLQRVPDADSANAADPAAGPTAALVQMVIPQAAMAQQPLRVGDEVHARERSFGLELARGDAREPFFLALADGWRDDLPARPVRR